MTNEQAKKFAKCLKNNYTIDFNDMADFCDTVIKVIEIVEEFEKAQIITGGRLNGRTYAYKCGLEDGKRKALEQQENQEQVRFLDCNNIDLQKFTEAIERQPLQVIQHISEKQPCKDCKHWKDSDGVYRRGIGAESKCPINIKEVYEGTFCCADFEKRGNENESIN